MDQVPNPDALETRLLEKASQDDEFRRKLLATPRATIEQELGVTLPPGIEIHVVEETPTRICIVLPMRAENRELSDQDLAAVAGGIIGDSGRTRLYATSGIQRLDGFTRADLPGPMPRANLPGPLP